MPGASAQELPRSASEQTIFLWRGLPEPLVPSPGDDDEEGTSLVRVLNRLAVRSEPDDFFRDGSNSACFKQAPKTQSQPVLTA